MRFFLFLLIPAITLAAPAKAPKPDREITFSRACESGDSINIAAVGDVLLHSQLQRQVYGSRLGHETLWTGVEDLIQQADFAYANLEGPVAPGVRKGGVLVKDPGPVFDDYVYSGYPTFNYYPSLVSGLIKAGFDVVSTANNHAMDRGPLGVDKTIESIQQAGLPFAGTRSRAESIQHTGSTWQVITEKKGWRIAWIACTFSTNGLADPNHQVLLCFKDADLIEKAIRQLAASPSIDAVIVTPHWGEVEYTQHIEPSQAALARRFANAGATAILGNHPHVTKPWEKIVTDDGRETFVIYSIGNFVSAQGGVAKQTSAMVYLGLTRRGGEKAWVNGVRYVPLYMRRAPYTVVAGDRYGSTPRESFALLESLLGKSRRMQSSEALDTTPECRR